MFPEAEPNVSLTFRVLYNFQSVYIILFCKYFGAMKSASAHRKSLSSGIDTHVANFRPIRARIISSTFLIPNKYLCYYCSRQQYRQCNESQVSSCKTRLQTNSFRETKNECYNFCREQKIKKYLEWPTIWWV
jgi:hypothetical protein